MVLRFYNIKKIEQKINTKIARIIVEMIWKYIYNRK